MRPLFQRISPKAGLRGRRPERKRMPATEETDAGRRGRGRRPQRKRTLAGEEEDIRSQRKSTLAGEEKDAGRID